MNGPRLDLCTVVLPPAPDGYQWAIGGRFEDDRYVVEGRLIEDRPLLDLHREGCLS